MINPFRPSQIITLSVCEFSLHYPHKVSCLVMRIKKLIIHRKLSKMKNKILPTCLQGNYRNSLGEFSNTSYGVVGAERIKKTVAHSDDTSGCNC